MSNKVKNYIGFSLLLLMLIVLKLFLGGTDLYHFGEEFITEIVILFIISFLLMIVPLVLRLINKKRLESKKGRMICLFNSLILFILFSIPNLVSILKASNNTEMMSIDPVSFSKSLILVYCIIGIIYYFVNICFFVDDKK